LVRDEDRFAAESDPPLFGVGPAPGRALHNAAALQLGGNAEGGKDDLGKIGRGIKERAGAGVRSLAEP
jgi:hypothetical protein